MVSLTGRRALPKTSLTSNGMEINVRESAPAVSILQRNFLAAGISFSFLVLASLPLVADQPVQKTGHEAQQNRPDDRCSPTAHSELRRHQPRRQLQHGGIDDDQENTKAKNGQGKSNHLQEDSQSSIHQADDESRHQRRLEVRDADAKIQPSHNPE